MWAIIHRVYYIQPFSRPPSLPPAFLPPSPFHVVGKTQITQHLPLAVKQAIHTAGAWRVKVEGGREGGRGGGEGGVLVISIFLFRVADSHTTGSRREGREVGN